jgi:hypothetical protein
VEGAGGVVVNVRIVLLLAAVRRKKVGPRPREVPCESHD